MALKYVRILYLLEGVCCLLFYYYSTGLLFHDGNAYEPVRSLYSSGSDDDVAFVVIGILCFLTFLVLIIRRKYSGNLLLLIVILTFLLQLLCLTLIEVGSVIATIRHGKDLYLMAIVTFQLLIFAYTFRQFAQVGFQE